MRCLVLILALCVALGYGSVIPQRGHKIVGGEETTISEYPSTVALLRGSTTYFQSCGGSILTGRLVLSAAHCFVDSSGNTNPSIWRVRAGSTFASSGGTVHLVSTIHAHESYQNLDHDVAVMQLASYFTFSSQVVPGSISSRLYYLPDNASVWAVGWGSQQSGGSTSEALRHVEIWTINQETCGQRYGSGYITDGMLCSGWLDVGGRDQCQGDSGGPLYHNGVIVGICSWGAGCADEYYPGVNARVSFYADWILAKVSALR